MISELPQLFGKNFLIGFVLPAMLLLLTLAFIGDLHGLTHFRATTEGLLAADGKKDFGLPVLHLGLLVVAGWIAATLLLGVNYQITQALEGYGAFNPIGLLVHYRRWHYRRLVASSDGKPKTDKEKAAQDAAFITLAQDYPEDEALVLATRFGNALRASERYPQVIYYMEPMQIWTRLQSIAPQSHLDFLADQKASMDFFVNLWFLSLIAAAAELAAGYWVDHRVVWPLVAAALVAAFAAANGARTQAMQYGELVKTTFDLYRGALAEQLGVVLPATLKEERALWLSVSQGMLFRDRKAAAKWDAFRKKPDAKREPFAPAGRVANARPVKRWTL
ncbi:MAG: hypothetical protein WDM86_01900 [Rhizomicrobium sp.]